MSIELSSENISLDATKSSMIIMGKLFIQLRCRINSFKAPYQRFWVTGLLVFAVATSVIVPCNGLPVELGNDAAANISELLGNATIEIGKPRINSIFNPKVKTNAASASAPILYRIGAPVLTGSVKVYIMYYGTWTSSQKSIIQTFISTLGSTAWFNIEKTYYYQATSKSPKTYISGPLTLGTTWNEGYSAGSYLSGTTVPYLIWKRISNGQLPNDPKGIYLLLSSADVYETSTVTGGSFCVEYCGYHSAFKVTSTSKVYFYGFIGNPKSCISGCTRYNTNISPDGDTGTDAMLSAIAHELVETMSDPMLNAWGDASGNENADKCTSKYGTVSRLQNGAYYNMKVSNKYYLVQQNWNAKTQACAMSA